MTLDWLELESLEKWKERRRRKKWRKTTTRFTSRANEEQEEDDELEENDGGEEEQQPEQETEGEQGENAAAPSVESKPRPTLQWDEEDETARAEEGERDQNKGKELVVRRSREEDEEDFAQRGLKHLARPKPQGQQLKEGGADAKANVIGPSSSIRQQHEAGQSSSFTRTAIYIDFEDVRYSVKLPWPTRTESIRQHLLFRRKVKRELLRGLSGHLRPGTLNAIMGPSGAGKTTLLNFLSGRLKRGSSSGDVLINGNKRGHEFKYMSAYVMQEETLLSNLTPRELLTYAAYLRLPRTMPWKDKRDRVVKVLEVLGLMRCADTRVGEPGVKRGISGGERRRVTIGLELMNDPQLIFLDEPTSGLDSATAESVVILLSKLAQQGRTVVCTIHQPSTQIFFTFDELLLLARGRFIYTGPIKEVTPYFSALGFPCPSYTNPADHVMHLVSKTEDITEEEHQQRIEVFIQKHAEHQKQLEYQPPAEYPGLPQYKKKRPNALIQFFVLLMRSWLQTIRDPAQTVQRLAQNIGIGLFTGFLWFQVDNNQTGKSLSLYPL
ncbi:ATPase, variant 2 [Balamuthia mandrillaris]